MKDSATVIDILKNKKYLENYGKSVDVFEELQGHQMKAIQYAKERVERLSRDHVAVICTSRVYYRCRFFRTVK